jgi:anti-sigma B factor antagonist
MLEVRTRCRLCSGSRLVGSGSIVGERDTLHRRIARYDGVRLMLAGKPAFQFLAVKEADGVAVITFLESASMIEGEKVENLSKELFGLIESKKYKKVLLNLYNAGYMSSAMLAQLVRLHRKMQEHKGKVRLCCLRPPVMDAFKISQFDRVFEIFPDEPAAMKKF